MKKKITFSLIYDDGFRHHAVELNIREYAKNHGIDLACRFRNIGKNLSKMKDVFDRIVEDHRKLYNSYGFKFVSAQMHVFLVNRRHFSFSLRPEKLGEMKFSDQRAVSPALRKKAAQLFA